MKRIALSAARQDRATLGGEVGEGRLVHQSRYGLNPNPKAGKQELS
jgi:hypothetical protein